MIVGLRWAGLDIVLSWIPGSTRITFFFCGAMLSSRYRSCTAQCHSHGRSLVFDPANDPTAIHVGRPPSSLPPTLFSLSP